jgi:hypothetical protein
MITSAKYTEGGSIIAVIDGVGMTVPDDMLNRHRVMIAEWEADGNTIEPYEAPQPPIPQVVSRFQARAALYGAGLLDDVETAIAVADPLVQMAWADAQEFQRNSPTILALAGVLGLSESDVDELFITASGIVA